MGGGCDHPHPPDPAVRQIPHGDVESRSLPRVLLLLPTNTYRAHDFMAAAGRLGVDVTVVSEQASTMESMQPSSLFTVDFLKPEEAAARAVRFFQQHPFQAVVPVDEDTAVIAARYLEGGRSLSQLPRGGDRHALEACYAAGAGR